MDPLFDIFLACAPKDFNKLFFAIDSIVRNVEGYDNIIICSPTEIPQEVLSKLPAMHYNFPDVAGLPSANRSKWKWRPNWSFQQHLKLFQELTNDWYLTFDADIIVNRPMQFFDNGKPVSWRGADQVFPPYFRFQEAMIGVPRVCDRSFIADMNLFHRPIINEMLEVNGFTRESFIAKSQQISNKDCHIGEPELYGNYWYKNHPDMYILRDLKQAPNKGRMQKDVSQLNWSEEEILQVIEEMKGQDYDTMSLHSWLDEGDQPA